MASLVGGSYRNARAALFANKSAYSEFLRNYYRGAVVNLGEAEVDQNSGVASIEVVVHFENKDRDKARLVLQRDHAGIWRIVASDPS